jgi:hypothetical protein
MRKAIIFDGRKWHVRRIREIEHNLDRDEKVYRCDKPISNDHATLADVPDVKAAVNLRKDKLEELEIALRESVKLQAFYAALLNIHDGGHRMSFPTPEAWIARLRETGTIR